MHFLGGKREGKLPFGRSRRGWKDNLKMRGIIKHGVCVC